MVHTFESVRQKLIEIFKERLGFDSAMFGDEAYDLELLGEKVRMGPIELLYIYTDIEKHFEINIPEEDIVSGCFNTINNISEIIYKNLEVKATV